MLAAAIEKGRRFQAEGRYKENQAILEEAVQRFPDDPEIRLLYATSLLEVRPDDAISEAIKAIELDPEEPIRLTRAAGLLFHMAEIETSRSYVTRATELAPTDFPFMPELRNLDGLLAAHDGKDSLAEEGLRAAVASEPAREAFARDLAKFFADRDRAGEAVEVIDQALTVTEEKEKLERLRAEIAGSTASGGN